MNEDPKDITKSLPPLADCNIRDALTVGGRVCVNKNVHTLGSYEFQIAQYYYTSTQQT